MVACRDGWLPWIEFILIKAHSNIRAKLGLHRKHTAGLSDKASIWANDPIQVLFRNKLNDVFGGILKLNAQFRIVINCCN